MAYNLITLVYAIYIYIYIYIYMRALIDLSISHINIYSFVVTRDDLVCVIRGEARAQKTFHF